MGNMIAGGGLRKKTYVDDYSPQLFTLQTINNRIN